MEECELQGSELLLICAANAVRFGHSQHLEIVTGPNLHICYKMYGGPIPVHPFGQTLLDITSSSQRLHDITQPFFFLLHRGTGTKVTNVLLSAVVVKLDFLLLLELQCIQSSLSGESACVGFLWSGRIRPVTSSLLNSLLN